jgi:hypothetical protein
MAGRLSRSVLSGSPEGHQEDAAWDLLDAVGELFPEAFYELGPEDAPDDVVDQLDDGQLLASIEEWTLRHRLACPAVDSVALQIAFGREPSLPMMVMRDGKRVQPPSITAWPAHETIDEFLGRAKRHYNSVRQDFLQRGYKPRPIKRERDHFRYLAAHLVGGYSWAEIARGKTPFTFSATRDAKTIAGEARKAARLVGISLSSKRGPRRGSKQHAPRLRRRR